jgi:hypothetical protein
MAKKFRACSIDDCNGNAFRVGHGLCRAHYHRLRRHGDPLLGGTRFGSAAKFFEEVALPYDGDDCLIWPYWRTVNGYGMMDVGGDKVVVSRAILDRTVGPPPTPVHQAAHLCGNGHNGCVAKNHLEWKTPVENNADKKTHGTEAKGTRNPMCKLTEDEVREIKSLQGTLPQAAIADRFGISFGHVSDIHRGTRWAWLE